MKNVGWSWIFRITTVLVLGLAGVVSCTLNGSLEDISSAEISFIEPAANSYSNDTGYAFKIKIDSKNKDITPDKAMLQVYEGADCDPAKLVSSHGVETNGVASQAGDGLEDGKKYSARVIVRNNGKTFQSVCSAWIGIDTQNPNPVSLTYPPANTFSAVKEVLAVWSGTTDNGISGLSEVPYRLRLFGQPSCAGTALQKIDSVAQQYKFKHLTQGVQYSVQVASVDKAGNESVLSCSPYTEIDVNVPGFILEDPTSSDGYSRVTSPDIHIQNDLQAAYWCLTTDLAFVPTTYTDTCPSGSGTLDGWYTSRPTNLPIGSGDGLKSFHLWIVRGDGSLISANPADGAITLDQTPPGNFTVTGVGGLSDTVFDEWFTSAGQPEVKWTPSTDAVDYTVDIRTTTSTLVCSQNGLTDVDYTFSGCPVLTNGQTYKVRITAFDIARNYTVATDFNFTVDRDPPGSFTITGITGTGDTNVDAFVGAGNPTVNYGSAANSSHYKIRVDDANGVNICTLGMKTDQSGSFDYASEGGVTCTSLIHGGTYKAYVSALDDGNNETQASNNGFSFQVDTVVPTLTLDTTPLAATSDTFANFTFSASDALSGLDQIQCQLDGGSYSACGSPYNLTGLTEGGHTLNVKALDKAGNVAIQNYTWSVDLTNPLLVIDSQPAAYTNNTNISISFHGTDASGIADYTCKKDGGTAAPCTSPLTFSTTEGSHTVIVRATDLVGYYDEETVSFIVDTTNPTLTLTSVPPNPSHSVSTGTVEFNMADANPVTATCQIDGGSFVSCSSPHTFTALGSGTHTAVIKATDAAGNMRTQSTLWVIYNYTWATGSFGACSASQPNWSAGSWNGCSVSQPAYTYDAWGTCSATCGGGWQSRGETCPVVNGTDTRSVTCPVVGGTQTRTVQCQRSDGVMVAESYCDLGTQPAAIQSCTRGGGTDCVGTAPIASQACSRGGGTDCGSQQITSRTCNTQTCLTWHVTTFPTWTNGTYTGLYCSSSLGYVPVNGDICTSSGFRCAEHIGAGGKQAICQ